MLWIKSNGTAMTNENSPKCSEKKKWITTQTSTALWHML